MCTIGQQIGMMRTITSLHPYVTLQAQKKGPHEHCVVVHGAITPTMCTARFVTDTLLTMIAEDFE